ncbi:MAG: radical SAM protein [Candidatus Riflebacteria bacterium]|nr:radical SAM protein [Candidatus Riflebacteria bacterium]
MTSVPSMETPTAGPRPALYIFTVPFWGVRMPPLGAAYVAAAAQEAGFETRLVDLNVECFDYLRNDPDFARLWDTNPPDVTLDEASRRVFDAALPVVDRFLDEFIASGAGVAGFSLNYRNLDFGNRVAARLREKKPDAGVVFGGPESFAQLELGYLFKNAADIFVVGEGERTIVDLLTALQEGRCLEGMPGVVVRREGIIMSAYTPRRPEMKLDRLPYPTYQGLPLAKYSTERLPMLMSRGCICHCRFCVDYILNSPYRFRSPEKIVEEMRYHLEHNRTGEFAFNDLLCNGNVKQLERLCDLIVEQALPVRWDSYAIVRKEMTPHLLRKMKAAGCHNICYGTESGSDRILRMMGKFSTSETAAQNIRDTHELGIRTSLNVVVGYPGETEQDFQDSLGFVERLAPYIDEVTNVSSLVVMPGSALSKNLEENGILYIDNADSWVDGQGSTPETRGARVRKVMELIGRRGLGHEIVNHDTHTAGHVMISVVLPLQAAPPALATLDELATYPFQLLLAGDPACGIPPRPRLDPIPRAAGKSLAACVNAAVERATGRYLVLCPPDSPPPARLLFELYKGLEKAPDCHIALPHDAAAHPWIFLRRTAFREVDGLDEQFGPDLWTADLLMRAHLWGYASASVLSARPGPGPSPHRDASARSARNALDLVLKNYPSLFLKSEGPRVARRLLHRMLPTWSDPLSPLRHLAGYYQALANFPRTLTQRRRILCQKTVPDAETGRILQALERFAG